MKFSYPSRIPLFSHHKTPIEKLDRLFPGREVYCKREDLTGTLLTGNKVRKLEFCAKEAIDQGADTLITVGGIQSNHARCTAAVAARLGLKCLLLLREGENQEKPEGNLLLARLLGAEIRWLPKKEYKKNPEHLIQIATELKKAGQTPYIVPEGGSSPIGSLGYISVIEEMLEQTEPFDYIITAIGSGGTFAGLYAGSRLFCPKTHIVGINVYRNAAYFQERIFHLLREMKELYQTPSIENASLLDIRDGFVGPGYAQIGETEKACIRRVAKTAGIFLDPAYTVKSFLGLEALVQEIPAEKRVCFLHTGGIFGLMVSHLNYFSEE